MTPGMKSSEFVVTILAMIIASLLLFFGKIDADMWLIASGLSSGSYAISRGLAKKEV